MFVSPDPGSYEVRYGVGSALQFSWFFAVPMMCNGAGIWKWPTHSFYLYLGVALVVIVVLAMRVRLQGILRRRTIMAIDSRGVFLCRDLPDRREGWEPWPAVDAVVHFAAQRHNNSHKTRHVGVVRNGFIANYRELSGSRIDTAKAAKAVGRYGGGAPFLQAPDQYNMKSGPVMLPDEWVQWAVRPRPDGRTA